MATATQTQKGQELVEVVRRLLRDVWSGKNPDAMEECVSENYVRHDTYAPGIIKHAGLRKMVKIYRDAFPDMEITLVEDSITASEDRVAAQYWIEGLHREKLLQIEPTNRRILIMGTGIWRIEDGKVAEDWHTVDTQTMFTALGILPCVGEMLEDH